MLNFLFLMLGIGLLTAGGEVLIRGALGAARRLGVSALLSGLVIVGFGPSAPELVVTVDAALTGRPDIAIGNVVGSNIGNVLLILGLCAVITPLAVRPLALRRDAVIAALRRHADVAIGNILGSNIFNLLGILGISALLQPLPVPARILQFDQWVMLGASLVLLLFLYTGRRLLVPA